MQGEGPFVWYYGGSTLRRRTSLNAPIPPHPGFDAAGRPEPPHAAGQSGSGPAPYAGPVAQAGSAPQAAYAAAPVARAPKRRGWVVAVVALVCLTLLGGFTVHSCTAALDPLARTGDASLSDLGAGSDAVGVIRVDGAIGYDGSASSPEGLKALLDKAEKSDAIKAVVLRVNSGGGSAAAGEEMAAYVKGFSKPIVVSSAAINASAAYEMSAMADQIFVGRTTEIGAIGTVMQITDLSELMEKLGIARDTVKSAPSKDSSYGIRPLTDDERAYYQQLVNELNDAFVANVAEGRGLDLEDARKLATGLPFSGTTAVSNGVADRIGTFDDALEYAARAGGISRSYRVVELEPKPSDLGFLRALLSSSVREFAGSVSKEVVSDVMRGLADDLKDELKEGPAHDLAR
ncbi:S49 family peptidase [Eggerthellaceae bacterium zg-1084]|uniref:S49 family peptidase n=1 Tax=Berryella wangjianweii TaxID=2734634 RepID=A0A6M8J7A2_9ACTN|nr:S49 family peptidase [Berryella wangjianweii]QKF07766.1 S49 family peptidase [Berryella wangjianweii]